MVLKANMLLRSKLKITSIGFWLRQSPLSQHINENILMKSTIFQEGELTNGYKTLTAVGFLNFVGYYRASRAVCQTMACGPAHVEHCIPPV